MKPANLEGIGALILRVTLGVVLIAHSVYLKGVVYTLAGTAQFFESIGLPAPLAYVVFAAEAAGGLALIVGAGTRVVALALVPIALGATWAHAGYGWLFTNPGGGWEYPLFLVAALLAQSLLGSGVFALTARRHSARAGVSPVGPGQGSRPNVGL